MFDDWLRGHLRERCGLRSTALNLLVAIVRLSRNSDRHCWARASYLGQWIERAERTVRAAIATLRSLGWIRTRATGRSLICTPAWEKLGLEDAQSAREARSGRAQHRGAPDADEVLNEGRHSDDAEDAAAATPAPGGTTADSAATEGQQEPTERPSAPVDEALAQVAARFGSDAQRDVAEVLATDRRATPDAARLALERLLAVAPARVERSVGAYFRRLVELASSARLDPTSRRSSGCAAGPVDDERKTQVARVNALKDELQRAELSIERRRQLTHALHQETEALIRLSAAMSARDQTKLISLVASTATPPPPLRPRAGPLPDWLAAFMNEQVEDAAAMAR